MQKHKYRKKGILIRLKQFMDKATGCSNEKNYVYAMDKAVCEILGHEEYKNSWDIESQLDKLNLDEIIEFDLFIDTFLEE